ncbi:MAG: hypothetical protein ACREKL_07655 [Chthoniobacterales bacterium]
MSNLNWLRKTLVCFALFAAVGAFDYFTGYEVSSYPMYLMPIFLTFFNFGKTGGYVAALIAIVMWYVIDAANEHHYSHEVLRVWNAASRFIVYLLFVYGISVYTKTVAVHRRRLAALRQLIPMCHGCGRVFGSDGEWRSPEEAAEFTVHDVPECPNCSASVRTP